MTNFGIKEKVFVFSEKVVSNLQRSSWIRAMFEEGTRLTQIYGEANVFDFSLGNPYAEPPHEVVQSLKKYISGDIKGVHRYMSNAGYPEVRTRIAESLQQESGIPLSAEHVVMTVGAAGGLNVVLKSILNPQEEVILFAPYFVEYNFYIDNHGGKVVIVPPDTTSFEPNLAALKDLITPKTKAIMINTPNNPTGVLYSRETLEDMARILRQKEEEFGTCIFVLSDQPYAEIIFDAHKMPSLLSIFDHAIIVNSFSKSLGLAGERIGFIALSSKIKDVEVLANALSFCNRTLGFVNAPGLFQKVVGDTLQAKVNVEDYQKKRDFFYDNLTRIGFQCIKPQGAFYLFPKALIEDDIEFVKRAVTYNLLLVPGTGFCCPGYFRISYCVSMNTIVNSIPAFEKLALEFQ
ncbi:MAG: Aspartate aminotransferase [Candidatus Dichloromethanomonas elyunquensis]|nr:MAG: Aspartate aminotransferase [Candidatus Dichloromethanomonas elyunquensis]